MEWLTTAVGAVLIATALRDVFHTLLQPNGAGRLTQGIFRGSWRLGRRAGERGRNLAAPLALATVAFTWAGMVTVGCALVYWPHMPERFYIAEGMSAAVQGNFVDALYISGVSLTTVGFGNVVAQDGLLRLVLVAEGLVGFALLSASISWVLAIYPALQRSRSLAGRISTLVQGDSSPRLVAGNTPGVLAGLLYEVSDQIGTIRVDLIQYPATYFFHAPAEELSLALALERLEDALRCEDLPEDAKTAASVARSSLRNLGATLSNGPFGLAPADARDAIRAYKADHAG